VEITKAKLNILSVNPSDFYKTITDFSNLMTIASTSKRSSYFSDECIDEIDNWFSKPAINKLEWLLTEIENISNSEIRRFLRVLVSDIVRQVSHQDPSDLRTRKRKNILEDAPVFELFEKKLKDQTIKIMRYHELIELSPYSSYSTNIWLGDSRDFSNFVGNGIQEESIDAVITSPPYATALPYIDTDRLSLLLLFGMKSKSRSKVGKELIGSRDLSKKSKQEVENKIIDNDFDFITSQTAIEIINTIYELNLNSDVGFRRKNMAVLLYRYFNNMEMVFQNLNKIVKNNGSIFIVIGDSYTIAGHKKTEIKTTQILEEIGENAGWKLVERIPITVTTENLKHIKNAIRKNTILWFKK